MSYELLSISEAARELDVCVVTLRRWDRKGKLVPAVRLRRGVRLYRKEDIERLKRMAHRPGLRGGEAVGHGEHRPQLGGETDAPTQ
jgi:excisionase family DNA binding protein